MFRKIAALAVALTAIAVSACGGRAVNGAGAMSAGNTVMLPPIEPDLVMEAVLPKDAIGEELPGEGVGSIHDEHWKATLGGFTQKQFAQALGFPPGTKITIHNLSKSVEHTLDAFKFIEHGPIFWPKAPKLSVAAHGSGKLEVGYASGPIKPGKTVTMTLVKEGTYLIGCAFHYADGMRDVIVVRKGATPGPQATPPKRDPSPSPTPTSRSSYDPGAE
jgi:plastocyanin